MTGSYFKGVEKMDMQSRNMWDAEWEISEEMASKLICSQFPLLASKKIKKMGHGWDNTVFRVGREYVFRFPRRKIAINALRMEGRILPKLVDYFSIPYSLPMFYGEADYDYPSPFLGYSYLSGDSPIGLTDDQRALSATALAQFLKGLHTFPVKVARENGIQSDHRNLTDIGMRKEKMQRFITNISSHLTKKEYDDLLIYLEQLKMDRVGQEYVLLHGDLHFKNMLVDKSGKVSGIIDWGDVNIGHPACDLNVVYSFLPPYARSNFFKEYGAVSEDTKTLARLIAIYIPLLILMQAIEEKDERLVVEAKANINRALSY